MIRKFVIPFFFIILVFVSGVLFLNFNREIKELSAYTIKMNRSYIVSEEKIMRVPIYINSNDNALLYINQNKATISDLDETYYIKIDICDVKYKDEFLYNGTLYYLYDYYISLKNITYDVVMTECILIIENELFSMSLDIGSLYIESSLGIRFNPQYLHCSYNQINGILNLFGIYISLDGISNVTITDFSVGYMCKVNLNEAKLKIKPDELNDLGLNYSYYLSQDIGSITVNDDNEKVYFIPIHYKLNYYTDNVFIKFKIGLTSYYIDNFICRIHDCNINEYDAISRKGLIEYA